MAEGAGVFIETERKYDAAADFGLPDLAGLEGVAAVTGPQTYRLRAVYFDTEDLSLITARITLRRRTGGADAGWHLKLPAGVDTRREVHAPLGRGAYRVPASLTELVTRWTGGRPLSPIARLATTRRVRWLAGQDGRVLAEIADDLVSGSLPGLGPAGQATSGAARLTSSSGAAGQATPGAAGRGDPGPPDWREVLRWREVEVELGTGTRDLLDSVGDALLRAGAVASPAASKLSRLLAAAEPAGRPAPGNR
jgi:hypothetical protein